MIMGETVATLPPQEIAVDALLEKYAKGEETDIIQVQRRVAGALASVEVDPLWEVRFLEAQQAGFVPAGRINSAAGTDIKATLINCFVQPVADAISSDDRRLPGIYDALKYAAETMRRGGGVGYNFSNIRPKGAFVKGTQSNASGPVSYIRVFDRSCETVESAGARRGAQMAVLNISHPDIEEFVHAKRQGGLTNFNMSVGVSNAFMDAVANDEDWPLTHKAEPSNPGLQAANGEWIYKTIRAKDLWQQIMESTYNHGEPGILFIDRINQDNNLHYCEDIDATNPYCMRPVGVIRHGKPDLIDLEALARATRRNPKGTVND